MTTSTVAPEIVAFASEVRAALSDLSREEVDDLTDGLEADLAESLAEDLRRTLPDPVAYAAELRTAAGLPGREPSDAKRGLLVAMQELTERIASVSERNPAIASLVEFADAVRPVWWIVRAWATTWMLAAFFGMERGFGFEGAWWVVMLGLTVLSIQWGRGRWGFPSQRELVTVGNIVVAVVIVPIFGAAWSWGGSGGDYEAGFDAGSDSGYGADSPLSMMGKPVTNVYAYDAAGQPLTGVQLFDQDGRPLDPFDVSSGDGRPCVDRDEVDCTSLFVPAQLVTGKSVYNVFPLAAIASALDEDAQNAPAPGAVATPLPAPFAVVPAVQPAAAPTPQPVAPLNE
ncbi:hypothetical protein [Aeromicrobium endophyticum]|uniref:Uncharacterized protein n=1 Tax=Aeromicrobium endophyticum TaxID=2292704 RepID=A0A371P633_9ACTN|nr:hypothetical protein [Aeromicrobium endophyticum]REK70946.1 hypothetical protein DX116_17875 [Aeromicrobium endophyticum]